MIDKYVARLKKIGEHEIAEYMEQLKAERDEAFSYLTFLLREHERADCRACKYYGACCYDFRDCRENAEYMPEVIKNNNQRKNQ